MNPGRTSLADRVAGWTARLALWAYSHSLRVLISTVGLCVLAVFGAQRLSLDADLARLLPSSFESVQALDELEARVGATGSVVIVTRGHNPEALRSFADRIQPQLEALPSISYVETQRPEAWFEDRALWFMSAEALATAEERIEERVDYEVLARNPMYVNLEDDGPPALNFDDLRPADASGFGSKRGGSAYYEDTEAGLLVLFARPRGRSTDLSSSGQALSEVRSVLESAEHAPEWALSGRLQKKADQQAQIRHDLGLTTLLALGLVALYLLWHFRSPRPLLLLGAPLWIGLLLTFGIVGATYGSLNILTAFIGTILLGLGIDHGIHLLAAYRAARSGGQTAERALERAYRRTGRAVLIASLTTIAGFAALTWSEFRAFREFGVIAGIGMGCITAAFLVVMPALLRWVDSVPRGAEKGSTNSSAGVAAVDSSTDSGDPSQRWLSPRLLLGVGIAALVLGLWPLTRPTFNQDFGALEDKSLPSVQLDAEVNRILGHSQTPTVVLANNLQQEAALGEQLRAVSSTHTERSPIDRVAALGDAVPGEQARKAPLIAAIAKQLDRISEETLDGETREQFDRLKRMTEAPPFGRGDLPEQLRRRFGKDAERTGAVLVFPNISLSDGARVVDYAVTVRGASGQARVAGDVMVFADILNMVRKDGAPVLALTSVLMLLVLFGFLRRFWPSLLVLLASAASVLLGVGLLQWFGGQLNYLNIVALPVLLGIAVDGTVHLLEAAPEERTSVLRAIAGALLTTICGFAPLMLATHPGLFSLGAMGSAGLVACAWVSLVIVFGLLRVQERQRPQPMVAVPEEPLVSR